MLPAVLAAQGRVSVKAGGSHAERWTLHVCLHDRPRDAVYY